MKLSTPIAAGVWALLVWAVAHYVGTPAALAVIAWIVVCHNINAASDAKALAQLVVKTRGKA